MHHPAQGTVPNPFSGYESTHKPLVAVKGARNGYLQLAPTQLTEHYGDLPPTLFAAATDWARILESLGAQRVYWVMLAEVVPHLHLHLYPRWTPDEPKGLPLFEARESAPQPAWTGTTQAALLQWAETHSVHVING
jgi:diadenosine tetraphosphate (Ap4A) HIT family hydrolase